MKSRQEINNEIISVIGSKFQINTSDLTPETKILNGDLFLNSIQMIELTIALENHFDFSINNELLREENFDTIDRIADLILNNKN